MTKRGKKKRRLTKWKISPNTAQLFKLGSVPGVFLTILLLFNTFISQNSAGSALKSQQENSQSDNWSENYRFESSNFLLQGNCFCVEKLHI